MNAISKRLLSWLCVIAMVFSFVPVMDLSGFAVTTKAAETSASALDKVDTAIIEQMKKGNELDDSDAAIDAHIKAGTCPMCGATGITWTEKTTGGSGVSTDAKKQHYYYAPPEGETKATYTVATNFITANTANAKVCVAVKSGVTINNTKYRAMMMGKTGVTVNIMGNGTIITDAAEANKALEKPESDHGSFQLGGGDATAPNVLNLYGCTFDHVNDPEDSDDKNAIMRIQSAYVTVNMYDGVVLGPATRDLTARAVNVRIDGGTFNMFGGTIRNGVSHKADVSGNVTIAGGKMYMYGGTITGGSYMQGENIESPVTDGGNVLVGGVQQAKTTASKGTFYMYDGLIEKGHAAQHGGNIAVKTSGSVAYLFGGTVDQGISEGSGGNIYARSVTLTVGGVVSNGISKVDIDGQGGGNIYVNAPSNPATITGTISNGKCTGGFGCGGNVAVGGATAVTFDGAVVCGGSTQGGKGSAWGGNIRAYNGDITLKNTLVYGGHCAGANGQLSYNVGVLGEKANTPSLTIENSTIVGGVHISTPVTYKESVTDTDDSDGDLDTTEEIEVTKEFVGTALTLKGVVKIPKSMEIDGVSYTSVSGLNVARNFDTEIKDLTEGSEIYIDGDLNKYFAKEVENAEALLGYFKAYDEGCEIAVIANQLVVIEKPAEKPAKPEAALGGQNVSDEAWAEVVKAAKIQVDAKDFKLDAENKAMCPACGEVVTWTEATYPNQKTDENGKYHFYIDEDTEVAKKYNWATLNGSNMTMCIMLLNGDVAKEIGGMMGVRKASKNSTFNIMGDGVITSNGSSVYDTQFGVVVMQGDSNTVNLYGGTFIYTGNGEDRDCVADGNGDGDKKDAADVWEPNGTLTAAAVTVKGSNNTVNMFDGVVIGPETQDLTKVAYNVRMEPSATGAINTFNMYGGVIRNGVTNDKATSGNVHLHYYYDKDAGKGYSSTKPTFNMYGGTIENGSYVQGEGITSVDSKGGNIFAGAGSQLSIYGGVIRNGKAANGGNIYANDSSLTKVNINGGTITGGEAKYGGNIYAYADVALNQYALVEDGHATANGGNIFVTATNGDFVQNAGSEVRNGTCAGTGGGNVYVKTSGTYDMKGGKIYGGKNISTAGKDENAGNVLVDGSRKEVKQEDGTYVETFTDAYFNMSGDAEIYGGIAPNQGGNVRVYIGTFTMTDNAKIYDGDGQGKAGSVDDLWMVDGNLEMSGNAAVIASETSGASVSVATFRRNNTATLSGNASITGGAKPLAVTSGKHHYDAKNDKNDYSDVLLHNTLQIANDWTGTTAVDFATDYEIGDTINANDGVCGSIVDGVPTAGGSFTGKLYSLSLKAENAGIIGVDGKLVVASGAVVGADGVETWFAGNDQALAAYDKANDAYVVLTGEAVIAEDAVISTNGQDLALSGEGTVSLIDPKNKDFKSVSEVTASGNVKLATNDVTVNGDRYITLENGNVWSAHYVEMVLTSVSLRNTAEPGLYYKASYKCDAALRDHIYGYGVALKANAAPTADEFNSESATEWTAYDSDDFKNLYKNNTVATISGALTGILKEESATRSAEQNKAYVLVDVYAAPYLIVNYDGNGKGIDTYLLGESRGLSFIEVLGMIDNNFDKYDDNQKNIITSFYATWKAYLGEFENF